MTCALLTVLLAGCAMPPSSVEMEVGALPASEAFPKPLLAAMCVRTVTGGMKTLPLSGFSEVDNAAFRTALNASLRNNGLLAASDCHFAIDADLVGPLPMAADIVNVHSAMIVNYRVFDPAGVQTLRTTVTVGRSATFSEGYVIPLRYRYAEERATRANIAEFLNRLRSMPQ